MAWFRMQFAANAFERSLAGRSAADLSPAEALRAMAAFYRDHRPQHASAAEGDDVLEVRWASHPESYELVLERRMRRRDRPDEERRLTLSYRFRLTPRRAALGSGQHGLDDPGATGAFVRRVAASAPWQVVRGAAVMEQTRTEA